MTFRSKYGIIYKTNRKSTAGSSNVKLYKKAIVETFIELLNEKPLKKISVTEIVNRCGITRNTFYYHFKDIYDLLEIAMEKSNSFKESNCIDSTHHERVLAFTSYIMKNKKAVYHIYNSMNRGHFVKYFTSLSEDFVRNYVIKQAEGLPVTEDDILLTTAFLKHAFVGIFMEWLNEGLKTDPNMIIERTEVLLSGAVRAAFLKCYSTKDDKN